MLFSYQRTGCLDCAILAHTARDTRQTLSMTINGYSQHLVSYYSLEDALCGRLRSPSTLPEVRSSPDILCAGLGLTPPQRTAVIP